MRVRVLPGQQKFICASTDGLERVAIRMSDWTPFPPFFQPLEEYMVETVIQSRKTNILEISLTLKG